jgi:hypothetical protein
MLRLGETEAPVPSPAVVQRTIHTYDGTTRKWEIAEIGTRGHKRLPTRTSKPGEFFNDVTGKRGKTIDEVRAGLVDQMMFTGSVRDLHPPDELDGAERLEVTWQGLAQRLGAEAEDAIARDVEVGPLFLGELFLRWNKDTKDNDIRWNAKPGLDETLVDETGDFVLAFMRANGQLAYIERQAWYTETACEIHIDLNFYYDRGMNDSGVLGMHKDTGGDNLFVNLIFNNQLETPATEWTQDREAAKGVKADTMGKLMPKEMVTSINQAKQQLGNTAFAGGQERIEGGTMPPLAFVSWVDELIWHSTPTLSARWKWFSNDQAAKKLLEIWNDAKWEGFRSEAIFTMSEVAGNVVYDERQRVEAEGGAFDMKTWTKKEKELKSGTLQEDIKRFNWLAVKKWTGRAGIELDVDKRTGVTEASDVPTGVAGRDRANSNVDILKQVKAAAANQTKRSFVRTWVRVVTTPSGEFDDVSNDEVSSHESDDVTNEDSDEVSNEDSGDVSNEQ